MANESKKFNTGDIVKDISTDNLYMVIYENREEGASVFAGAIWDGKYLAGMVPCVRVRKGTLSADRRFMSVRTTKNVIGQFRIYFIRQDYLVLYRRVANEKAQKIVSLKYKVEETLLDCWHNNFGKEPKILVMRYDTFHDLVEELIGNNDSCINQYTIINKPMYKNYKIIRTQKDVAPGEIKAY